MKVIFVKWQNHAQQNLARKYHLNYSKNDGHKRYDFDQNTRQRSVKRWVINFIRVKTWWSEVPDDMYFLPRYDRADGVEYGRSSVTKLESNRNAHRQKYSDFDWGYRWKLILNYSRLKCKWYQREVSRRFGKIWKHIVNKKLNKSIIFLWCMKTGRYKDSLPDLETIEIMISNWITVSDVRKDVKGYTEKIRITTKIFHFRSESVNDEKKLKDRIRIRHK